MKKIYRFVAVAVILVAALIATGFSILAATDPTDIRDFLTAQVKEDTGWNLVIARDLDFEISLAPSVVVPDVVTNGACDALKSLFGK